jgi:hypothetical protein
MVMGFGETAPKSGQQAVGATDEKKQLKMQKKQ